MRVLVNASTLVVGGGVQVGISFIQVAIKENRFDWKFIVSKAIYDSLDPIIQNKICIICIPVSPAKPYAGMRSRQVIQKLCKDWNPDLIYSIGFPSYIRFKQVEIGRYTNPWEINNQLPWKLYPGLSSRIKIKLGIWYRQFWARNATYIETQTEAAKQGIINRVGFPQHKIKVIPNSPNQIFLEAGKDRNKKISPGEMNIFCLAAPYPHKNLSIVPQIAASLNKKFGIKPYFFLTLPQNEDVLNLIKKKAVILEVDQQIINLGKLSLEECLVYYQKCSLVFLPTLLEIFSATYLEAMAMGVPIVTTDLDFAHDNCKDAAHYFNADDLEDAADKIHEVLLNPGLRTELIQKGYKVLDTYPKNELKYKKLFEWFEEIIYS